MTYSNSPFLKGLNQGFQLRMYFVKGGERRWGLDHTNQSGSVK